ncbi:MAG: HesA/MoeB/ThiF family protein [bacterium]|nr:HesA/MoeB/ThiF family protein [bacterium]
MAALDEQEMQRYDRQLRLPDFGLQGQARLKNSSILIVGLGGLGTPAAQYLAAAGVGRLGLVDDDRVELHNLQRQILYTNEDIGAPKVECAAARLRQMNPGVEIETHQLRIDAANAGALMDQYSLVLDGTDHIGTRQILNRLCVERRKALIYGALFQFEGVASVFCGPSEDVPCYACLHGSSEPASGVVADCNDAGVLGVLPGIIGTLQATEAIKLLAQTGRTLAGRLLQYDALNLKFREWSIRRDPECAVCGAGARRSAMKADASGSASKSANASAQSAERTAPGPAREASEPMQAGREIREISVGELQRRLNEEPDRLRFRVLDVREPHELEVSALPAADIVLIPVGQLADRLGELDRDIEYAVLCKAGGRSKRASEILAAAGFAHISNVTGGINAWAREIDPELPEY